MAATVLARRLWQHSCWHFGRKRVRRAAARARALHPSSRRAATAIECFMLIVPENREQPEGREVRLKVAVLKAKRTAGAEPMVYLSGGPGDAPLVASSPGADALAEGDWWNETANIRRRRDVIILSQRGAGGSTPNLDCFDPRTTEPAKARRRAVTEQQERDILMRCRAGLDRRKIDLGDVHDAGAGRRRGRSRSRHVARQDQHLRRLLRHALGAGGDAAPSRPGARGRARRRLPAAGQRRAERARDRAPCLRAALRRLRHRHALPRAPSRPARHRRGRDRGSRAQAARAHPAARGRPAAGAARRRQAPDGAAAHDARGRGGADPRGGGGASSAATSGC